MGGLKWMDYWGGGGDAKKTLKSMYLSPSHPPVLRNCFFTAISLLTPSKRPPCGWYYGMVGTPASIHSCAVMVCSTVYCFVLLLKSSLTQYRMLTLESRYVAVAFPICLVALAALIFLAHSMFKFWCYSPALFYSCIPSLSLGLGSTFYCFVEYWLRYVCFGYSNTFSALSRVPKYNLINCK